ncbi:hypothetical protein PsYK624_135780 [Phanerochaete sordida]|uniref:Fungal-type protein kinase domain-containing protein n=1 Tax=Phanerochaete sordida TaxID=48140 RepID=A0A9P3LKL2_9APHY|nr:hypothetical protein PsYK624_135780 [Phanerochaete sordida]
MADSNPYAISHKYPTSAPGNLAADDTRGGVLRQEHVPQVEWSYFEDALLPPLRLKTGVTIDGIVKKLRTNSAVAPVHGRDRWSAFAQGPPSSFAGSHTEDEVFEAVLDIVTAITRAYDASTEMPVQYRPHPKDVPRTEMGTNDLKLDGCFVDNLDLGALTEFPHRWRNVIVPSAYRLQDTATDVNDSATQMLWSLTHIMREDARRRFVIGFSIENTRMRLWFMSRSDIFVSFPEHDFTTAIDRLVSFFIRIMWAKPHELGLDSTIVRQPSPDTHGGVQYDILVGDKWYRTQRLISAIGAESPRGRGTRVWEVRELDKCGGTESGPSLVLKDSWVDQDRPREAKILDDIRASVTSKGDWKLLKQHLLTVRNSADVLVEGVPDDMRFVMRRAIVPIWEETIPVKKDLHANKQSQDEPHPPVAAVVPERASEQHVVYHRKVHHRVVFKEMGTTIMEVGTFTQAFSALGQVIKALKILHKYGWVHRDISSGNILVVANTAKLADVEYAKRETDDSMHDVRTGTLFFMATELDIMHYRFDRPCKTTQTSSSRIVLPDIPEEDPLTTKSVPGVEEDSTDNVPGSSDDELETQTSNANSILFDDSSSDSEPEDGHSHDDVLSMIQQPDAETFRHNPLHDLESVLWLGLYIVTFSVLSRFNDTKTVSDARWEEYLKARKVLAAKLFYDRGFRHNVIQPSASFFSRLWNQHPRLQLICGVFNQFRKVLVEQYETVEGRPGPITFASATTGRVHDKLALLVDELADPKYSRLRGHWLRFTRNPVMLAQQQEEMQTVLEEQPRGTKRAIGEDGEDGQRKKLKVARREKTNAYTQDTYILRDRRAGVTDSVGAAYKQ